MYNTKFPKSISSADDIHVTKHKIRKQAKFKKVQKCNAEYFHFMFTF